MTTGRSVHTIVRVLAAERKSRDLSGHELARITGYDHRGIAGWEAHRNVPSLQAAMDWAEALGYEIVMLKKPGGRQ